MLPVTHNTIDQMLETVAIAADVEQGVEITDIILYSTNFGGGKPW